MSFIFDALRKSESERQRGATPGLADVRHAGRSRQSVPWLPLLGLVLLANLLLLVYIWRATGSSEPAAAPAAATPAPAIPVAVPAPGPAPRSEREVRPLAREPVARAATSGAGTAGAPPPARAQQPVAANLFASELAPTDPDTSTLPRFEELISSGRLDIPPLGLELHVWSELPASRFVFINGSRYREGERLSEGPRIESITSTGLILDHNGERFVLPRQ